jgi:hypothetical protein
MMLTAGQLMASVQSARADDFDEFYRRGSELAKQSRYVEALTEFEAAYHLNKLTTLALNIGLLNLKLRRPDQAQRYCGIFLKEEKSPDEAAQRKATECMATAKTMIAARRPTGTKLVQSHPPNQTTTSPPAVLVSGGGAPANPGTSPAAGTVTPPALTDSGAAPKDGPTGAGPPLASTGLPNATTPAVEVEPPPLPLAPPEPSAGKPGATEPILVGVSGTVPPALSSKVDDSIHRPIYKRWWFWTIVGVVAAGAAAGITAGVLTSATSTSSPSPPAPIDPLAAIPAANRVTVSF